MTKCSIVLIKWNILNKDRIIKKLCRRWFFFLYIGIDIYVSIRLTYILLNLRQHNCEDIKEGLL